ncbi:hypothetical protein BGZ65_006641 [Modicella reniformis]|uniref:C2H2-type domain-containing protein n=1 Tax=Modicella reniformis TaxID=1440133 RepID=A0A9P6LY58_9FUNG|nr:hypothetical protein BGZ65_006641 [Modicella reniformis]
MTTTTTTTTATTIRSLKLDFDHEKAFFRCIIEKSTLVKDPAKRAELVSFLKNPSKSGLPQGASLLASETWLIELKEQQGTAGSLFLAMDIQKGIVKALFIPESMLERRRQAHPGEGIVITDRSGLCPSSSIVSKESPSWRSIPTTILSTSFSTVADNEAVSSEKDMEIDSESPNNTRSILHYCGWRDCGRNFTTMTELSLHVQHEHLQNPLPGSRSNDGWNKQQQQPMVANAAGAPRSEKSMDLDFDLNSGLNLDLTAPSPSPSPSLLSSSLSTAPEAASLPSSSSLQQDGVVVEESYQSLSEQIAKTKEMASLIDQQIRDSRVLYASAVSGTKENIKRLEAHLEWESKKWAKYQDQTSKMRARMEEHLHLTDAGLGSSNNNSSRLNFLQEESSGQGKGAGGEEEEAAAEAEVEAEEEDHQMESNHNKRNTEIGVPDVETAMLLDKPMEAQSINSIRGIQKLLSNAKENLTRLENDNRKLFERRRILETELKTLEERFRQTTVRRLTLKDKENATREELEHRTKIIEDCKATMEQEQIDSRKAMEQLQAMIGMFAQSTSPPSPSVAAAAAAVAAAAALVVASSPSDVIAATTTASSLSQQPLLQAGANELHVVESNGEVKMQQQQQQQGSFPFLVSGSTSVPPVAPVATMMMPLNTPATGHSMISAAISPASPASFASFVSPDTQPATTTATTTTAAAAAPRTNNFIDLLTRNITG